ncbi:hypothetical protein ARSEF1564_010172, partial [Beauveria bassiana]
MGVCSLLYPHPSHLDDIYCSAPDIIR